jgi:cytochrome P450
MAVAVGELALPGFEYLDPTLKGERFHAAMRELRESGWLASMPLGYVTLDREAGEFFLRSRSFTFPGLKIAEIFGIDEGPLAEEIRRNILHINGPDHSRLRGLVNPAFTPRTVERWRPFMRETIAELFAETDGRADAVEALAKPYPSRVIATLMGAPIEDAEKLWDWSNLIQRQFGMTVAQERPQIEQAVTEFYEYTRQLLEHRRSHPGDDLISSLMDRADDAELLNLVLNVLVGGVDTTQALAYLAPRMPNLELDGDAVYGTIDGIYGLDALPLRWATASSRA